MDKSVKLYSLLFCPLEKMIYSIVGSPAATAPIAKIRVAIVFLEVAKKFQKTPKS